MRQPTDLAVGGSARGTASDSPRPATRPDRELPFTGSAAPVLLAVGPALVANGILLVRFGTRRLQPPTGASSPVRFSTAGASRRPTAARPPITSLDPASTAGYPTPATTFPSNALEIGGR
jgi:hypothetical protein